jgi:hypothetical protein
MLSQAYVYPPAMRAPRDLLRRRNHLMRKRAELPRPYPEHQQPIQSARDRQEGRLQDQPGRRGRGAPCGPSRDSVEIRREPSGSRSMDRVQEEIG